MSFQTNKVFLLWNIDNIDIRKLVSKQFWHPFTYPDLKEKSKTFLKISVTLHRRNKTISHRQNYPFQKEVKGIFHPEIVQIISKPSCCSKPV